VVQASNGLVSGANPAYTETSSETAHLNGFLLRPTLSAFKYHSKNGANDLLRIPGAIAQLGERLNGIQEVGGSIPPGSTKIRFVICAS
jgi:hypothetical protein